MPSERHNVISTGFPITYTYTDLATGTGPSASVAAKLLADPELRRILTGPQGHDWLKDPILRQASVSFLVTQQRFSSLDTPEVKVRYDAFISYTHNLENRRDVLQIVEAISKEGVKVFFDEEIKVGERWSDVLTEALSSAGALLFCIGRGTSASRSQMRELEAMRNESDMRIIPILLPGSDFHEVPVSLEDVQWVDFRGGISSDGLDKLISALKPVEETPPSMRYCAISVEDAPNR